MHFAYGKVSSVGYNEDFRMGRSASYIETAVSRSAIQAAVPYDEDYTKQLFEMRLFYDDDVLANAATTIDPYDVRHPKAIRGIVIALRDMTINRAALYFEGHLLSDVKLICRVKSGDHITVDWCVVAFENENP